MRALAHVWCLSCLDKTSMMRWSVDAVPIDYAFGDTVRQVILLSRDFDFRSGVKSLKPENARRIRELYKEYHHPNDPADNDPITSGYQTIELYGSVNNGHVQRHGKAKDI